MDWDEDNDYFTEERDQEYWRKEELKLSRKLDLCKEAGSCLTNTAVLPKAAPVPARTRQSPSETRSTAQRPDNSERREESKQHTKRYYTVFVGNVPLSYYEIHLEELFESYGRVYHVYIQRNIAKDANVTYGFVRFEREHEAERAIKALDKRRVDGKRLHVSWSQKPQDKGTIEQYVQKRNVRLKEVSDLKVEDDHKLWCLIETYTMLLAQTSTTGSGSDALPDLGEFLNNVNRGSCNMAPARTMHEHDVSMNLDDLQDSFIESFSNDFAVDPVNMGLLAGEDQEERNTNTRLSQHENNPPCHPQQHTGDALCNPQTDMPREDSSDDIDKAKTTLSEHGRLSVKERIKQTTAPYVISYGRGRKIPSLTD